MAMMSILVGKLTLDSPCGQCVLCFMSYIRDDECAKTYPLRSNPVSGSSPPSSAMVCALQPASRRFGKSHGQQFAHHRRLMAKLGDLGDANRVSGKNRAHSPYPRSCNGVADTPCPRGIERIHPPHSPPPNFTSNSSTRRNRLRSCPSATRICSRRSTNLANSVRHRAGGAFRKGMACRISA